LYLSTNDGISDKRSQQGKRGSLSVASNVHGSNQDNRGEKHGWNAFDNYKQIFHDRVIKHPFVDHSQHNTIYPEPELKNISGILYCVLEGELYCKHDIVVTITNVMSTKEVGGGRVQVRGWSYRYNAHIKGQDDSCIIRYDNVHGFEDYHKHFKNPKTGKEDRIPLTRDEFPHLHEVLDELEILFP